MTALWYSFLVALFTILAVLFSFLATKKANQEAQNEANDKHDALYTLSQQQSSLIEISNKELRTLRGENKNLARQLEDSRFLIPDTIYGDVTIDIKVDGHPRLESFRETVEQRVSRTNNQTRHISLSSLLDKIGNDDNAKLEDDFKFLYDQIGKIRIEATFIKNDGYLLHCAGVAQFDEKDKDRAHLDHLGHRDKSATLVYLQEKRCFSIYYQSFPFVVEQKSPKFSTLFDFEGTDTALKVTLNNTEQKPTRLGVKAIRGGENSVMKIYPNRLFLGNNNLFFAYVVNFKENDLYSFTSSDLKLTDINRKKSLRAVSEE